MTERSEYYNESAIPSRNLHRENLEQEEREITRRTSALAYLHAHYEHRHALYWSDFVTDLLDDMSESDAAELESAGWPALMETLEEQQYNARHP
jgi:predicted translin family RNA/ssDNA-binding protein